jgi:hypothetical protein
VAAKPFNLNISCDSQPRKFTTCQGHEQTLPQNHGRHGTVAQEQEKQNISFPIIIKPTIISLNFRSLPEIVRWAIEAGATAVNFQPLGRWTSETYNELWMEEKDWPELDRMMQNLISM